MPNQDTGDDDTDEPSHFLFPGLRHRLHNPHGWSSSTSSSDNVAIGDIDAQVPHRRRNQRQLQQPDVNVPSSSRDPYAQPPGHRVTRAQHATQNDRRGFYGLFGLATPMGSDVDYSDVQLSIRSLPRRPPVDLHAQPSLARTYRFVASGIGPGAHQVANQSGRRDVLYTEPSETVVKYADDETTVVGTLMFFNGGINFRSQPSHEDRLAMLRNRQLGGSCPRCRHHHITCRLPDDRFVPCVECQKHPNLVFEPCIRVNFVELKLHRKGSTLNDNLAQWVRRKQQLDRAAGGALTRRRNRVKVLISQGGHVAIPVFIAPFCEERDDDVSLPWLDSDGNQRHLKMPPYLVDDTDLASRLKACVTEHRRDYVDRFLSTANPIARKVFAKADRYAQRHKSSIVSLSLNFWVASRFIEGPWYIQTRDLVGFHVVQDPDCPYRDQIPATPVMDTQIDDTALRELLLPWGQELLSRLRELICDSEKRKKHWFQIFLAIFILMNNFSFIFEDISAYTTRHGMKRSSRGDTPLSMEYYIACKTLLVYFHFACNGHAALSMNTRTHPTPLDADLYDERFFLEELHEEWKRHEETLSLWMRAEPAPGRGPTDDWERNQMYTSPEFWYSQLFNPDWKPELIRIGPTERFTEEDLLTSNKSI